MTHEYEQWGGYTEPETKPTYNYSVIIEHAKNPNALDEYLEMLPKTHLRNNAENVIQLQPMESRMLHAINLHQHVCTGNLKGDIGSQGMQCTSQSIPEPPKTTASTKDFRNQFGFLEKNSTDFTRGKAVKMPVIDADIKNFILSQCVATIFAHIGFETTSKSTLYMLRDILAEFLTKICRKLRLSVDTGSLGLNDGFPDEMERIFTEIGIGGLRSLHDFYNQRIINYPTLLCGECHCSLKEPDELDKEDVPEFHLSGGEDDHKELKLQPELQLLDFLEQNVEFPLLDGSLNMP